MAYPRVVKLGRKETLVSIDQLVDYREHMAQVHRILFFTGNITGEVDSRHSLLALDTLSHDPIKIVITSPGGDLDSTFLYYDTMRLIQSPIITIGEYCASAAVIILAAGQKRYLQPHAKVMMHPAMGRAEGDYKDWDRQQKQILLYQNKIIDILIENGVKKGRDEILADIDREMGLEPLEAISYGVADGILTPAICILLNLSC